MTTELKSLRTGRELLLEEYMAHGVLLLTTVRVGSTLARCIQVEKMRETMIDMQPRPYKIFSNGIEVYPKEKIF
jgi:KaiC/GvpD/RAD55 family RecA-like ATPase